MSRPAAGGEPRAGATPPHLWHNERFTTRGSVPETAIDPTQAFASLSIALGLGLLVGLQRERADPAIAGLRTFGLVGLLGAVCGLLGGWMVVAGLLALGAFVVLANVLASRGGPAEPGLTTEAALLLIFAVGALAVAGPLLVAVVVGATVAVLLQFKQELHGAARRLSDADLRAIFQFVLLSLVILPVLPDRAYGPYDVLNPRQVWWMVVLIVGIGLAGYVGYQILGTRAGTLVGGLLGGLVSSTATTAGYARMTREGTVGERLAARVVLLASVVVFGRVLVEIAVVAPEALLPVAAPPLLAVGGALAVLTAVAWWLGGRHAAGLDDEPRPAPGNPSELRGAFLFAALYALVLLAVAWARDRFGSAGVYAVAVLSGLTDMDAVTLSTSQLVAGGQLAATRGWRAILIAALANLVFKGGMVAALGSRRLLATMALWWGLAIAVGVLVLVAWPG